MQLPQPLADLRGLTWDYQRVLSPPTWTPEWKPPAPYRRADPDLVATVPKVAPQPAYAGANVLHHRSAEASEHSDRYAAPAPAGAVSGRGDIRRLIGHSREGVGSECTPVWWAIRLRRATTSLLQEGAAGRAIIAEIFSSASLLGVDMLSPHDRRMSSGGREDEDRLRCTSPSVFSPMSRRVPAPVCGREEGRA